MGKPGPLIGQRAAETLLARGLALERVGHAYLFLGPQGVGKATAAHLFAQALNCARQPAAAPHGEAWSLAPCGECESCRRIAAGTHPEVLRVLPGSKTGQNITVEQAREIRKNASLRPKLGERRIYVIPNAEAFNEESANALLKTLEEPSDFVTLILCAPNPSQVLPTIRSRCRIVRFGLAPAEEIALALTAGGTTPQIAAELARASGGRPGLALTWAREPSVLSTRRRILDVFERAVSLQSRAAADPAAAVLCFRLAEELRELVGKEKGEKGEDEGAGPRPAKARHIENLETGLSLLRDLLLLTQGAPPALLHNQERVPQLLEVSQFADHERVLASVRSVREAQQLLDRNVAPQLVLERMFWALIAGPVPAASALFAEAAV